MIFHGYVSLPEGIGYQGKYDDLNATSPIMGVGSRVSDENAAFETREFK